MGHTHQRIVNRVHQCVERLTVWSNHYEVRKTSGRKRDLAANEVGERDVLVWHTQTQCRLATLGAIGLALSIGEIAL